MQKQIKLKFLGTAAFAGGYVGNNCSCNIGEIMTVDYDQGMSLLKRQKGCWQVMDMANITEEKINDEKQKNTEQGSEGKESADKGSTKQESEQEKRRGRPSFIKKIM